MTTSPPPTANYKNTRKSGTGYVIFINGVAVSWKSKSQHNVSLSTTEAEYVAVSEAVRELKFVTNLLDSISIEFQKPIEVKIDNVGALFLVKSRNTSERTRHIDARYHYIRELVDEGLIKIEFIRSEDNVADIFTKNLGEAYFNKHKDKFNG